MEGLILFCQRASGRIGNFSQPEVIALHTIRAVVEFLESMGRESLFFPMLDSERNQGTRMQNVYKNPIAFFITFRIRMTRTYEPPKIVFLSGSGMDRGVGYTLCNTGTGL